MTDWVRIGRPKAIGSRKKDVYHNYDALYGNGSWRLPFIINGSSKQIADVLVLYEEAYFKYFKKHPDELKWIADNFENVYDNNPSNVNSGLDYTIQEFEGNHFQDIAIRNCMKRTGLKFKGKGLLEIRLSEPGIKWNPSNIPFHESNLIVQPELKGWWKPGSIESWYQSGRFLEVKNPTISFGNSVYFVTSNKGKVESARRSLDDSVQLEQIALDISEEQDNVENVSEHKARVAYSVLCRPVICDDSGFVIPSLRGYPGIKVSRELKRIGIEGFTALAKNGHLDAAFVMSLAYFDESLDKPKLFVSRTNGKLISEVRGDITQPHIKSPLGGAFVIDGYTKTVAEMNPQEYKEHASTNRWGDFVEFLKSKRN